MTKVATLWSPQPEIGSVKTIPTSYLETQDSFYLETQDGSPIELSASIVTLKENTLWTSVSKNTSSWRARDGYTKFTESVEDRISQDGETRITQDGETRTTQGSTGTSKSPTVWSTL